MQCRSTGNASGGMNQRSCSLSGRSSSAQSGSQGFAVRPRGYSKYSFSLEQLHQSAMPRPLPREPDDADMCIRLTCRDAAADALPSFERMALVGSARSSGTQGSPKHSKTRKFWFTGAQIPAEVALTIDVPSSAPWRRAGIYVSRLL